MSISWDLLVASPSRRRHVGFCPYLGVGISMLFRAYVSPTVVVRTRLRSQDRLRAGWRGREADVDRKAR
ncbi:hypothetical protein BO71DRAFT_202139 [Aspergillus ellipticus CBS 707.79]|uniref:Uncharacterized protein n=1 Tax=Aspergillus ellipticus CBS 707.79 TaxID=1448320 RepID=A0A319DDE1_9EURO|nr:hypothetical protein BO71DRAFT_202139 [Aspergillus ellipticus CBS 707.79]